MSSPIEVWKLQRPLMTNGSYQDVLAYTENKKRTAIVPVAEEDMVLLFGDEDKVYVKARIKRGNLQIIALTDDKDW